MIPARPTYCELSDITTRLFSGQSTGSGPTEDPGRDIALMKLARSVSRRFDRETGRLPGGFAPVYDSRLYSGRGSLILPINEMASVSKVEYNTTPGRTPTWTDVTAELQNGQAQLLPLRGYPKTRLWRINIFVPDPYRTGNIRVTGVHGNVQPDPDVTPPTQPWQGITNQTIINSLSPDGNGNGWWVIDEAVTKAIAEWTIYTLKSSQAGYSDTSGSSAGGPLTYRKGIPPEVQMVIDSFPSPHSKVGSVTVDGEVLGDIPGYLGGEGVSRWAGWGSAPASNFPGNTWPR